MSETPSKLGPYPVERELGRGGMGVVYLGRDPKLNRPVAIKVLPDALANTESLARFDREAKLLASLNHPNIATIYGIEEAAGQRLLILEYIPGDTLAGHIARGPLPLDEALDVCRQVALAIEAAHEGGVIHRDLKPGNIKITPDGQVKVLDFGLAKGTTVSDAELAHSPTMTFAATGMGVILGTAGYMSPEQARGKAVDRRTDIWSFGCVLFECLSGKQIFGGETVSDTIAKILERDPDWSALPPGTPAGVREILRRCLEKDLKKRQRDIGDVRIHLDEAVAARSSSMRLPAGDVTPSTPRFVLSMKATAIATLLIVVGAAAGIGLWSALGSGARDAATVAGPIRASIAIPPSIRAMSAGITPDGRTLLVSGAPRRPDGTDDPVTRLYRRQIDDYEIRPIPGTERYRDVELSSDGKWLAIVRPAFEESKQLHLLKLPLDGSSPPVKIATIGDGWEGFAWLESGDFLIALTGGKKYIRLPKGTETPGPEIPFGVGDDSFYASVGSVLPGDRGVFVSVDVYSAKGWSSDAWVLDLTTNKTQRLIENAGFITYSPTGHVVFSRGDTLMTAPFDLASLKVTGEVKALSGGLRINATWGAGTFGLSQNGTLVYTPGGLVGTDRRLVSFDAMGNATAFGAERRGYVSYPAVSRDGRRVAVVLANEGGTFEIWTADQDQPVLRRTIAIPNVDCDGPHWSPDSRRIQFNRTGLDKEDGVYVQNADGTGTPQVVMRSDGPGVFLQGHSWTPDGSGLIVSKLSGPKASLHYVSVVPSGGPAAARALRTTTYADRSGQLSPDGRFIAFESDESGKYEVYVSAWSPDGLQGRTLMVSSGGGGGDIGWAADSRRLFFGTPELKMMAVTIDAKPTLTASKAVVVHDLKKLRVQGWNILPDGRVFAIQRSEAEDDITHFSVVFNWFDELRARMAKTK